MLAWYRDAFLVPYHVVLGFVPWNDMLQYYQRYVPKIKIMYHKINGRKIKDMYCKIEVMYKMQHKRSESYVLDWLKLYRKTEGAHPWHNGLLKVVHTRHGGDSPSMKQGHRAPSSPRPSKASVIHFHSSRHIWCWALGGKYGGLCTRF